MLGGNPGAKAEATGPSWSRPYEDQLATQSNLQKLDGGAFKDKPLPQAQCLIQHMPHDVCSMLGL